MNAAWDDMETLKQIAVNLFYGWGYNFYRLENHLRADDQTVRAKVGWLLGQARASVEAAESAWRRAHIFTPTREKPLPDPEATQAARRLEEISRGLGALEGQIRSHPVPEADLMTNRYRREAETLQSLLQCDLALVGRAETLRALLDGLDGEALLDRADEVNAGVKAIERSLRERQAALHV